MEKLKSLQPMVIVILICLTVFQFVQISRLKEDMSYMESNINSLENKLDKRSTDSEIWYNIYDLKKRVIRLEAEQEEQQDEIKRYHPLGW